ncbi:MAG TPA: hypothetical protein VGG61_00835 [Gemmataceae bacterium]
MIGLFPAAPLGSHLSNIDAETFLDELLQSVPRADRPATAVLCAQQRQLDAA